MSSERIDSFDALFQNGLEYVYDAEKQLALALPKMAQAASSPQLREAFEKHLQETQTHAQRLETVFSKLGLEKTGKPNSVVFAMTEEADKMIKNSEPSPLRDAALIVAGTQVEHYEITSYGSLLNYAELLGHKEITLLFAETITEEKQADQKLTEIGESEVNLRASKIRQPAFSKA